METSSGGLAEAKIFTPQGRLGRLRYIAYGMGASLVAGLFQAGTAGVAAAAIGEAGAMIGVVVGVIIGIGIVVLYVFWTIRRLHDFNLSGWFTFIFILPLIQFCPLAGPGDPWRE